MGIKMIEVNKTHLINITYIQNKIINTNMYVFSTLVKMIQSVL